MATLFDEEAAGYVTSREGRVSRNFSPLFFAKIVIVTSREGRVSRNDVTGNF